MYRREAAIAGALPPAAGAPRMLASWEVAEWVDLLCLLASVAMQGGPEPYEVFDQRRVSRDAHPDAVVAVLSAFAGYMVRGATRRPPPGLPNLPAFQRAQGDVAVRWLRRLVG